MPLIQMYFGKGALSDEQKVDLSRKVTDLIVQEPKHPQRFMADWRHILRASAFSSNQEQNFRFIAFDALKKYFPDAPIFKMA